MEKVLLTVGFPLASEAEVQASLHIGSAQLTKVCRPGPAPAHPSRTKKIWVLIGRRGGNKQAIGGWKK
jgi:hypothetical protein